MRRLLPMTFTPETMTIMLLTIAIIIANIMMLLVLFKTEMMTFVNKYFFASLVVADLCMGLFVTPFSFWTSMFGRWIYGEKFCHIEAYLAAIFWIASVYSLTWLSIDHYVAIRKPDRYESLMTPMRSMCWVIFVWVAALSFCCPPIFGVSRAGYYKEAYICIIDWSNQKAYFVTSGLLIIIPPLIALSFSNLYIFTSTYKRKKSVYEKCTDSHSRSEHYFINFLIGLVYLISWSPWCLLQLYLVVSKEHGDGTADDSYGVPPKVHFYLMWLAVANSFWKFTIYAVCDHDFRIGLKILYSKITCRGSRMTAI